MEKPLSLIGLDPGAASAYAVLDLTGRPLKIFSAKELPLSRIISQVIEISQPLISATDKEKVPSLVQEFSTQLGTLLISPDQDLKREEKDLLVNTKTSNQHEHDALAAALFAFKKIRPTLTKIDDFLKKNHLEELRNPFTQLVLKENLNLEAAKKILTSPQEENKIIKEVLVENRLTKTDFLRLSEKLNQAQKEKLILENKLHQFKQNLSHFKQTNLFLAQKLTQTSQKIDALLSFKEKRIKDLSQEFNKKEKETYLLSQEILELKELLLNLKDKVVIPKVKDLGQDFKKKAFEIKEGDFLFVENPSILSPSVYSELKEKGLKLFSKTKRKGFFVLDNFLDKEDFVIVPKDTLEKALSQKDILSEVLADYQKNFRKANK